MSDPLDDERQLDDWAPSTEADRIAVREELERILVSPLFRNSRRYPKLLRYVVEQALLGHEALLKERNLGVAVFDRSPDYDTNQDTVVRLTAGEVRKRIAQFYHQEAHPGALQLDLRPGSYIPVFRRLTPRVAAAQAGSAHGDAAAERAENDGHLPVAEAGIAPEMQLPAIDAAEAAHPSSNPRQSSSVPGWRPHRRLLWLGAALVLLAVAVASGLWWRAQQAADRQLWDPMLAEPGPVQLVVADLSPSVSMAASREQAGSLFGLLRMGEMVNFRDSLAQTAIATFLAQRGKGYSLALSTQANYPDLQRSASVLIGGLDNLWTMRVTDRLRYHFIRRGPAYTFAIEDRQHPELGGWGVDLALPTERANEDYAIVARVFDQTTGRPVLIVAGLGANGTSAAARFLTDPAALAELSAHAPRDWRHTNMEAVIHTQILDNHSGPPHLVACYFW